MSHIDEDTLVKLSLDTVDGKEKRILLDHLNDCSACNERYLEIRREMEILGSIETNLPPLSIPLPSSRAHRWRSYFRLAAGLVIGFVLGYGYFSFSTPRETTVVASYLTKSVADATAGAFVVCESVDLSNP